VYSLILLGFVSFLITFLITPPVRNFFRRVGCMDYPDGRRKFHKQPIPRIGGIIIATSYVLAYIVLLFSHLQAGNIVREALPFFWKLAPAAALVLVIGLLDDLVGLRPWQKLSGQVLAAVAACWSGVYIGGIQGYSLHVWLGVPITIVWLLACTNAFNLIDGVDGLSAGIGLFATVTMLLAALLQKNVPLALATVPLAGALLGFLRYNFSSATIFLGDSGSLLIGFLLGCYGVLWSDKSATILGISAPMMALAVPLLDTTLAIARRFLRQQSIFAGDRGHVHHRLLDRGFSPRKVALSLYGVCAIFALLSLSIVWQPPVGLVIVLFCTFTWICIQYLGYLEFEIIGRMFRDGSFRHLLTSEIYLHAFKERLAQAASPPECWEILRENLNQFGFHKAQICFGDQLYRHESMNEEPGESWIISLPLSDVSWMELHRKLQSQVRPNVVAGFVDVVHSELRLKAERFESEARHPVTNFGTPDVAEPSQSCQSNPFLQGAVGSQ
jgi:UDP-GlcNAc:undecaprenyl-phosphate GlcNAc-1-phosphate transferase